MKTQYKFFILLLSICFCSNSILFAQAGSLDPSFGNNGIVYNDKHDPYGYALQADGKILVAGYDFIIDRYNEDGSVDAGFGNNGTVKIPVTRGGSFNDVVYLSDGKFLASGSIQSENYTHFNIIIVKCLPNGNVDSSFGVNGLILNDYGVNFYNESTFVQPDGKIVITGERRANVNDLKKTFVIRYNADGTLDNSFGIEGTVITAYNREVTSLQIVIQPDGKILTSGTYGYLNDLPNFMATRYMADGQIDESFGENGIAFSGYFGVNPQGIWHTRLQDMALQPDNKILVAGQTGSGGQINTGLCRFNADGSLDMSFGIEGKVITSVGNFETPTYGIALQPDGKIIAGGQYSPKTEPYIYFSVFRYQSNGVLDSSFGKNGRVTSPEAGEYAISNKVIIQPDSKILLLGPSDLGYSIARYFNDNVLAANFKEVKATQNNEAIIITWQTLNESGTKSFTVERSSNANDYVGINTVPAKGVASSYSYTDKSPLDGTSYYRIRENAANGTNTFSPVVKMVFNDNGIISLYPNPAKNTVTVKGLNKSITTTIRITDMNGREISKQNFTQSSSATLNIRVLAQGS
ncbi:MAG: T9SS type A sorting domain-containing protein, partial [Chitinophagaceae bacterium]